jgi:hypothetical protein
MGDLGEQNAPLYVFIGVDSGVMLRSLIDPVSVSSFSQTEYMLLLYG